MSQAQDVEPHVKRKTAALTIRMTQETRDILEAAARREQRSVSEMAEIWITAASRGEQSYRERIGGSQVAEAIEAMLQFTQTVEAEIGNPRTYLPARDALLAGWRLMIDKALPYTPNTPEGARYHLISTAMRVLARHVGDLAMHHKGEDEDQVSDYVFGREERVRMTGNLFAEHGSTSSLYEALRSVADGPTELSVTRLLSRFDERGPPPSLLAATVEEFKQRAPEFLDAFRLYMTPRLEAVERSEALVKAWEAEPLPLRR